MRYFPTEEYEERWSRLGAELARCGYDAAVIWGRTCGTFDRSADITYLSNYYSSTAAEFDTPLWNARGISAVIFQKDRMPELHTDEALHQMDVLATDRSEFIGNRPRSHFDVIASVADALKRNSVEGRVALVGSEVLTMKHGRQLQERTPQIAWEADDKLVQRVRRIKSSRELDCYRQAGEIASMTSNKLMEGLITGKTQAETAAEAVAEAIRRGGWLLRVYLSHGSSVTQIVGDPMYAFSMESPKTGDLVRAACFGPWRQGYYMDPIRTAVCGRRATSEQKRLVETCVSIVNAMTALIRPGTKVVEVADLANKMRSESGYDLGAIGEMWPNCWGHGLGLFWEEPWIISALCDENEVYEESMVIGVEAFLAAEGIGIAGVEDNLIVTKDGPELLTTMPQTYW